MASLEMDIQPGATATGSTAADDDVPDQITELSDQETQEWHQAVTPELRNMFVRKLVHALSPLFDPEFLVNNIHNVESVAQKVEGELYDMATSRSEYYDLLAEQIYKIQKEFEDKLEEQQQEQQPEAQQQQPQMQDQQEAEAQEAHPRAFGPNLKLFVVSVLLCILYDYFLGRLIFNK